MSSLDTLSPADRWPCPMCKKHVTMRTTGVTRGGLRPHKAGDAGTATPGQPCPGAAFSPFRPAFPQEVRLFGLAAAIERVRAEHGKPEWLPEPKKPGDLQTFVLAVWPQADLFTVAPLTGERRGVTFTVGAKRWAFAAYDSYLSGWFTSRADATDALLQYLKESAPVDLEPELDVQDSPDLSDFERTTEELAEIMSTGGVIGVPLGETVTLEIALDGVLASVHTFVDNEEMIDDMARSTMTHLRLTMPTMEEAIGSPDVQPEEMALLLRAFEARNKLLGK
ncbi:hypothetical protein [Streptomyces albidoflavus]|uniref:hypothetical protein n=1 Tax=Streptomyces albidoflavus TaxID=1886 RepID=UPI0033D29AA8